MIRSLTAHGAFAFEALMEALGENCRLERLGPDAIVFMDRSDGSRYEITFGPSDLHCLRFDRSRPCPPQDPQACSMRQRLRPGYEKRRRALELALCEIDARAAREAKRLLGAGPASL